MSKLVVLNLGHGDLYNGFPVVIAQLRETDHPHPIQLTGSLPPAPAILELYRRWQLLYELLYESLAQENPERYQNRMGRHSSFIDEDFEIDDGDITQVSDADFNNVCQELQNHINTWFNADEFRTIDQKLRLYLAHTDEIRVIIETEDNQLRKIPWHLWSFFQDYPHAEIAVSAINYEKSQTPDKLSAKRVRILAILGNSTGIDVEADRQLLKQLPDAEISFLVEPSRRELNAQLWHERGWDILFFAGHSASQADGEIGKLFINQNESLTISQLKNALSKSIVRGLKIAIFNSCDGLGLARELACLHIPQMIVMREPVPDQVAQDFLKEFLTAFSRGESFYLAVREAREKLQGLENDFPGASWLPLICQNPAAIPPSWQDWLDDRSRKEDKKTRKRRNQGSIKPAFMTSVVVTGLVIVTRYLGLLQPWELKAYDYVMRSRPDEAPDSRLLVVTITDKDLQLPEQENRRGSLSDEAFYKLVQKLEAYQPRVIGLDIFRDPPDYQPKLAQLKAYLRQDDRFFTICHIGIPGDDYSSISPPPGIPRERLGFSNVLPDSDGIVRRHLLSMGVPATSPCTTPYALSFQLATHYLKAEGITPKLTQPEIWVRRRKKALTTNYRLKAPMGGYKKADTWGNQILLNYRSYRSIDKIAPIVTLTDVLQDKVQPELVKNRIILIGAHHSQSNDYFLTPYSQDNSPAQQIPGVILHAQMVSQILSAVLDGRPLLTILPPWGDILWIGGWSGVAGILAWRLNSPIHVAIASAMALVILYGGCYYLFTQGIWIPLVPSALAIVGTSGGAIVYSRRKG
ncbi:MAG: CHASE2 domain-containing protein [Coleofasciculus sp. C1-SOL-03]|uniref:CHASE2 domain-containing protein n=1 Tax=Coleofasciculus sp. C1-SOL-03 TaxID=3069522 RepID=UPI003303E232